MGNQSEVWDKYFASFKTAVPTIEIASVTSDEKKAKALTPFSFLKKKDTRPVSNGTTINKTGIISLSATNQLNISGNIIFYLFPEKKLQYKNYQHTQYHQQHIITYLPALQQPQLAAAVVH